MNARILDAQQIKWGYALSRVPRLPKTWAEAAPRVSPDGAAPRAGDVLVAQVATIGQHSRIDVRGGVKVALFEGDLVGLTFAPRYATRQFQAEIPASLEQVHFVCAGGVCGRVVGIPGEMAPPTELVPLGYLREPDGGRLNARSYALTRVEAGGSRPEVIIAVGASMDSGKTTAAYSLINGLTRGGISVGAAKITGTASAKDPLMLGDAGAARVIDFTHLGFGSTADLGSNELQEIVDVTISNLARERVECIVLEIADGITQRETAIMLEILAARGVTGAIYACNDSLGVRAGVERVRRTGIPVLAVSGMVTSSPLGAREAQLETDVPVLTREDLRAPTIASRLGLAGRQPLAASDAPLIGTRAAADGARALA